MKKGLVIVNTGMGKGKTTAALGTILRAWGRGLRVCVVQFIKAETGQWGEIKAAQKLGIEWHKFGDGFTWLSKGAQDNLLADALAADPDWTLVYFPSKDTVRGHTIFVRNRPENRKLIEACAETLRKRK